MKKLMTVLALVFCTSVMVNAQSNQTTNATQDVQVEVKAVESNSAGVQTQEASAKNDTETPAVKSCCSSKKGSASAKAGCGDKAKAEADGVTKKASADSRKSKRKNK